MTEYIDRQAAVSAFENGEADVIEDYGDVCDYGFGLKNIKDTLNAIPPADVAPVRRGEWIHNENYVLWADRYVCSECNRNALTDGDYRHVLSDYCPHCGARMDGGADNG